MKKAKLWVAAWVYVVGVAIIQGFFCMLAWNMVMPRFFETITKVNFLEAFIISIMINMIILDTNQYVPKENSSAKSILGKTLEGWGIFTLVETIILLVIRILLLFHH